MEFYDIVDQSDYQITVTKPEKVEDLSDMFITEEELQDMIGYNFHIHGHEPRKIVLKKSVENEVQKWIDKLEASGKKTFLIKDQELLDILKTGYLCDYAGTDKYCRHGDRICFARRYKRVKKKPTKGDVRDFWCHYFPSAFRDKYGCYPPHIPTYDRSVALFKAFKNIVGWRRIRSLVTDHNAKFIRQIWDNPQEYM